MAEAGHQAGWTEHERAQRQAWLRLTARQRLDWLWEARSFALRAAEARRRRVDASPRPEDKVEGG